jgi:hypothetical protein
MELIELKKLYKDKRHDHYWIEDGILFETYKTIRGLRYRGILEVPILPDNDRCDDDYIIYIEKEFLNK